jgi:hypothetical protein
VLGFGLFNRLRRLFDGQCWCRNIHNDLPYPQSNAKTSQSTSALIKNRADGIARALTFYYTGGKVRKPTRSQTHRSLVAAGCALHFDGASPTS